jgi:hypothetical protein
LRQLPDFSIPILARVWRRKSIFIGGKVNVPDEIDATPDEIVIKKERKRFVSEIRVNVSGEIMIYKERKYFSSEGKINVPGEIDATADEIVIKKERKCFVSETKVNVSDKIFCQQEENTIIKGWL